MNTIFVIKKSWYVLLALFFQSILMLANENTYSLIINVSDTVKQAPSLLKMADSLDLYTSLKEKEVENMLKETYEAKKKITDTLLFYQELPFLGLNGNIDKIVQKRYRAMPTKGEFAKRKSRGEEVIIHEKIWIFDENGYPKQFTHILYGKENKKVEIKVQYKYDGANMIEETIYRPGVDKEVRVLQKRESLYDPLEYKCFDGRGSELSAIRFIDYKKKGIRIKYDIDVRQNVRKTEFIFKNNKIVREETYIGPTFNNKIDYKYKDNDLMETTEVIVDAKPVVTKYIYPLRDEYKNWTQRVMTYYNDVPKFIEEQEITYK